MFLSSLVLVPLIAALIIMLLPRQEVWTLGRLRLPATTVVATIAGLLTFAISLIVFIGYDWSQAQSDPANAYQFVEVYSWLPELGITIRLGVDGISAPMVLLTGLVIFTGAIISWKISDRSKEYYALLLILVSGVFGVFVTLDLFFLFFFYEVAVLPMYLLIAVWGSTRKEYAAMKLTIFLLAASILVWVAMLAVFVESGAHTFDLVTLAAYEYPRTFQIVFLPMFFIGFGVLAGMWPFHTWSPDGHVAAPTAVSMLHAGVLMKLGAYGIIRVGLGLLPEGVAAWAPFFIVLGTINVVYGALSAMAQRDLKFVIGYSSVSHMGYVVVGISTLTLIGVNGAVLQMFSHGVMTALFFALVGVVYDQAHTREIGILGGLAQRMPWFVGFFAVAGLASLGLPGLSGFIAELLVFTGAFQSYPVVGVLCVVGVALTAAYILRLMAKAFFGPLNRAWDHLHDMSRSELVATTLLVLTLLIVGLYPRPFLDRSNVSVEPLLERIAPFLDRGSVSVEPR